MTEFKAGDKIESVSDEDAGIHIGGVYVVTGIGDRIVYFNDNGKYRRSRKASGYKLHTPEAPPATITHEGYTYTRGERIPPDWVKDGAWVVSRASGTIVEIVSASDNFVRARAIGADMQMRYEAAEFAGYFRPFTAKDWRWGMWADYDGKRVFVMTSANEHNCISVSYPDIYPLGANEANRNFLLVSYNELTPTK